MLRRRFIALEIPPPQECGRAGIPRATTGPGNAAGLADLMIANLDPDAGAILHLAGSDLRNGAARQPLAKRLRCLPRHRYRARAAPSPAAGRRTRSLARRVTRVLLFSPRTASIFAALTTAFDMGHMEVLLSSDVAVALDPDRFARILVSAGPTKWHCSTCSKLPASDDSPILAGMVPRQTLGRSMSYRLMPYCRLGKNHGRRHRQHRRRAQAWIGAQFTWLPAAYRGADRWCGWWA